MYSNNNVINLEIENNFVEILDSEITWEEVLNALTLCKKNKAPGEDGIPSEFYVNLPQNWKLFLATLLNKILRDELTPDAWSIALVNMLFKKGDASNPDNYRPIALMNSLVKIFTQVLLCRCKKWCEVNGILPEFQSGFRNGRSC